MTREQTNNYLKSSGFSDEQIETVAKAYTEPKWDRLYNWLNDMRYGIAPDENTPDDERREREAQVDVIDDIMEWIEKHPQEPKTGTWEEDIDNSRRWDKVRFYCSKCGSWQTYGKTDYCPSCGARMVEPQERSGEE